jgi:hypothetical protein
MDDDRAEMKVSCKADDGNAHGRRYLLEGIIMVMLVLPLLEHQGQGKP